MSALSYLNKYLLKYKWRLFFGLFFVSISNIFGIFPAQIVRHAFDLVKEGVVLYRLTEGVMLQEMVYTYLSTALLLFGAIVLSLALLKGLFMFLMRQSIIVMSRHVEYDLKNEIYDHFQNLSLSFYVRNKTGDMMARITEDVTKVRMYLGPAIMYSINMVSLIVLVVIIMLSVNPVLTMYVLMPFPFLAVSIYYVSNIMHKRSTLIQQQLSALTTYVQEMFSGIRLIKSFAAEKDVNKYFENECEDYRKKSMGMVQVDSLFFPLILLLVGLSMLITLYVGGIQVMNGYITPGNVAEFFIYVNLMSWPVAAIGWVTSLVQRAAASQKRINEFLNTEPDIKTGTGLKIKIQNNICFENISYTYPDTGIKALKDIDLCLKEDQTLGIIGSTGSGKTTLIQLLMRSFDPVKGRVTLDGTDLKDIDLGYYRRQIGYVPQDEFLFSDTIANNILFGHPEIMRVDNVEDGSELYELLKKITVITDVFKDITDFPKAFNTRIGERGVTLSGGQKQRIAIARAIVGNPALLVLDDCFSAVDTYTENRILSNLSEVLRKKTSVIVSHRVSTLKNANHILVLDQGIIIEQGTHNELFEMNGYYKRLHDKQLLEKSILAI